MLEPNQRCHLPVAVPLSPERIHHPATRLLSVAGSTEILSYPLAWVFGAARPGPASAGVRSGFLALLGLCGRIRQVGIGDQRAGTDRVRACRGGHHHRTGPARQPAATAVSWLPDDRALINRMGFQQPWISFGRDQSAKRSGVVR